MKELLSAVVILTLCIRGVDVLAQDATATHAIRGRVNPSPTSTPGSPVPGIPGPVPVARGNQVNLNGKSAAGLSILFMSAIAADGSFEFRDVPKGEYAVTVLPGSIPAVNIVVGDSAPAYLEIGDSPARVNGTVTVEGGGPHPPFVLEFTTASGQTTSVQARPEFSTEMPPGSFVLSAKGLPSGFAIRSMTAGATDLVRQPLTVRSGETARIAITLGVAGSTPWVKLSGRVTGNLGSAAVRGIQLTGPATPAILTAAVGADGSFEFPQVLPGEYRALMFPSAVHFAKTIVVGNADTRSVVIAPPDIKAVVGEFVAIPPGEFMMGCSPDDAACEPIEKPAHRVAITRPFEIGKYEVTQAQWETAMGTNPSQMKGADRPVDNINTWNDAKEFIGKLNAIGDGYFYRLPTEAEWEYAARAGTSVPHPGGLDAVAWYSANSGAESHPVGQKQPNAWGLFDTIGNVAEWVEDWHGPAYYAESPVLDPLGPKTGSVRFLRGGAWAQIPNWVRVSSRRILPVTYGGFGLRLVREAISR
jgi:formylglycine-generating enzyme required for sulfatase activity